MTELQLRSQQAMNSLRRAVAAELDKKRRLGQYAIICKDGKPVRLEPTQIAANEDPENYGTSEPTSEPS